jgi:chromosome segregation ATPase
LLLVTHVQKCANLEVELSKMRVAAKEEEERMQELEEAKLEAEEAQLALEENRFEVLQLREELAAAKAQAKAQDEPGCDVAALHKEVEELRAEKERLAAETAAAKERDRRSRKDLESMTEKSQAVVRLNAQLMTQIKQLKASHATAGSE